MINNMSNNEKSIHDKSSKLYLRLRLAGKTFPPKIVYKIFTNSNICDIGSYAPRYYHEKTNKIKKKVKNCNCTL